MRTPTVSIEETSELVGLSCSTAYAESKGTTLQLLVAVTYTHILGLNRDPGERLAAALAVFERAYCEVTVRKFGLSHTMQLRDTVGSETPRPSGSRTLRPPVRTPAVAPELVGSGARGTPVGSAHHTSMMSR